MTKILSLLLLFVNVNFQTPKKEYVEMLSSKYKVNLCVIIPFKKGQSKHFFLATNDKLYSYHLQTEYRHSVSYKSFLNGVFEGKISFDPIGNSIQNGSILKEDLKISKEYNKYGINFIKRKYLKFLGDEWRNKVLDSDTMAVLIKIMFDNNYVIWFSEYSGFYSFRNIKYEHIH
ncbi:hypothetical protein NAF17_03900 [Mucilaginibacter sp. RB4R14]|uniref:hypothetical protein n=1 Tax=Mucilaginibacter aurantiaciroseus TaxID=2949308 RepID=UPI0020915B13|nr:hypothetical protein [Mucilaginibacter aurantiaciroseus]MCO5934675.1 hypothetical protein [Mucilaginibacter aurantiaciroseus]